MLNKSKKSRSNFNAGKATDLAAGTAVVVTVATVTSLVIGGIVVGATSAFDALKNRLRKPEPVIVEA